MTDVEPAFAPVKQRRNFQDVILQIETAIHEGRIKVGDRLPPERELAETFNVGRASVREALRVLETLGVVSARRGAGPDSGSIVTADFQSPLSGSLRLYTSLLQLSLTDLLEVREALEELAARLAAERATAEQIADLHRLVDKMKASQKLEEFFQLDTEFHVGIAIASGNSVAPLLMGALRDAISREMLRAFQVLESSGSWPAEHAMLTREHAELLSLIERGDARAAPAAFKRHVRGFYERVQSEAQPKSATTRPARKRRQSG